MDGDSETWKEREGGLEWNNQTYLYLHEAGCSNTCDQSGASPPAPPTTLTF